MLSDDDTKSFLHTGKKKVIQPLEGQATPVESHGNNEAADLIRQKLNELYDQEPDAEAEINETENTPKHRTKHQQYMHNLSTSGKSLADIQTDWHKYYVNLPDSEKHEVWQEFYANYSKSQPAGTAQTQSSAVEPQETDTRQKRERPQKPGNKPGNYDFRPVSEIRKSLIGKVYSQAHRRKQHVKSLLFGFSMGIIVLAVMLFGFFNERFIAPFITPSRNVSATPIIVSSSENVSQEPKIIIPKINVDIPVVYGEESINEDVMQNALEEGVVHYPITPKPGEKGNAVIFGHSSNNILNRGKYKFAFVLLNRLREGDTFMLNYKGTRYVYKVFERKVVKPTDLSVLGPSKKPSTVTLITCDPPGTSINRLVVVAEQITPDPKSNNASSAQPQTQTQPEVLPSNAPSLWDRMTDWL